MKLSELEATFLKIIPQADDRQVYEMLGSERKGADGIQFLCPKCFKANNGKVGTHAVICWFIGTPAHIEPQPGRWNPQGSNLDDLTFIGPRAASVLLTSGCKWHGFIKNGTAV